MQYIAIPSIHGYTTRTMLSVPLDLWVVVGLLGQAGFFLRFLIQWLASERKGESVVPVVFWYFSIVGGAILFLYAWHIKDPVFILGQGLGLLIYGRNLFLIRKKNRALSQDTELKG